MTTSPAAKGGGRPGLPSASAHQAAATAATATTATAGSFRSAVSRVRWPVPTRRGFGTVVAGAATAVVGFVVTSAPLLFAGVALIALVVAALVVVAVRLPRVEIARRFSPSRAVAGWSVVETVSLATSSLSDVTVLLRDTLSWRTMRRDEAVTLTVPAGGVARADFVHEDLPRGRHRIGPARIDVVESFGLARRRADVHGRGELLVHPETFAIGTGRESRSLGEGSRQRRDHSVAGGQDDPITREYRRGDPMRRVHWRATARQGELMVRQEEQHGLPSARVVLPTAVESWRDAHAALGSGGTVSDGFEWAVATAASIAIEFGRAGSQTRLVDLDGGTLALHDPSTTGVFLDALSDLALGDTDSERSPEASPREPVIAIVSTLRRGEIERLGRLRGPGVQGTALVVSLDGDPLTPADVAADSPAQVAAALRESGWSVVEAWSSSDIADVVRTGGVLRG